MTLSFQGWLILILLVIIAFGSLYLWLKFSKMVTNKADKVIKETKIEIKVLTKEIKGHKKQKDEWDEKIKNNENLHGLNSIEDFMQFSNSIRRYK